MKVRGNVKLMCDACKFGREPVTRTKAYLIVTCTKNPRHKQRTKVPRMHTVASSASGAGDQHQEALRENQLRGSLTSEDGCSSCGREVELQHSWEQDRSVFGVRSLLAARQTACIGELYWRSSVGVPQM